MLESTSKAIEIIGASADSWEQAARNAINEISARLKEMRMEDELEGEENGFAVFRACIKVSFVCELAAGEQRAYKWTG